MKRLLVVALAVGIVAVGCGGGGGNGGGGIQGEAVKVTLNVATPSPAIRSGAATRIAPALAPAAAETSLEAVVENVGDVTVRGFVFTHYDGGAGFTPGLHTLYVCQKCFDLKDGSGPGGCNYIFHLYDEEIAAALDAGLPDPRNECKQGVFEYAYMSPGDGYCNDPAENPELDCTKPATWRILVMPIYGFAGGGGKLIPGDNVVFGVGYPYPPGTYSPRVSVSRWDGTLFDNDARTVVVP